MPNDHVTGLPDDPREACQRAISLLIEAELSDAFMGAKMFARLIGEAAGRENGDAVHPDPVHEAIEIAALRLEREIWTIEDFVRRAAAITRHGTGKYDHNGERRAAA